MNTIYVQSHNLIELTLTDSITEAAITDATVSVTITDSSGDEVSGETFPLALSHVASGLYRASISSALAVTARQRYTATVTATTSGSIVGVWAVPLTAAWND